MHTLYTRVTQEWQDLHVTYPVWLHTLVMDDLYYVITLVAVCITSFAVGMIIGIVMTIV
jgi:MFS superfamily sulfate permease-like transporter